MERSAQIDPFALLDTVAFSVFILEVCDDGMPRYAAANASALEYSELSLDQVVGKTALEVFGGVAGQRGLAHHLSVVANAKEVTYEVPIPRGNKVIQMRTTLSPLFNSAGELTHLVGSSMDVTARKELNNALELTKMAKEKAEHAVRAKERFLANVSHEIRTPMNGIMGMCELLRETALSDQQRLYSETIYSSANALLAIVNDVLDFSKIQSDTISVQAAPFSLRRLITETVTLLGARAATKGLSLKQEYPSDVPEAFIGDGTRMRQVLLNLVGNAIKFTTEGHVLLRVSYNAEARLPLRIDVVDTGVGIAPEDHDMVFSAFEQVDRPEMQAEEGTGLGLAITRAVVERMGGKVSVQSARGAGSTFTVSLGFPVADVQDVADTGLECVNRVVASAQDGTPQVDFELVVSPDHRQSDPMDVSHLRGLSVLVAEDNKTNQLVVEKMLSPVGVSLTFVEDGLQAVSACETGSWDVILMDLLMPRMGGLEAARRIRDIERQTGRDACHIVALTANAQPSDVDASHEAGMDDFLSKPFRKRELFTAISREKRSSLVE